MALYRQLRWQAAAIASHAPVWWQVCINVGALLVVKARVKLGDKLSQLLESTGEGVYGTDMFGCCTVINRAGGEQLGWQGAEAKHA